MSFPIIFTNFLDLLFVCRPLLSSSNLDTMDKWDQAKLDSVILSKHGNPKSTTDKVCKFFLDAVEDGKYGWFWEVSFLENGILDIDCEVNELSYPSMLNDLRRNISDLAPSFESLMHLFSCRTFHFFFFHSVQMEEKSACTNIDYHQDSF